MDLRKGYYQDVSWRGMSRRQRASADMKHTGGARGALGENLPSLTGKPTLCQVGQVRVFPARGALLRPCYKPGRTTDGRGEDLDISGVGGTNDGDRSTILPWTFKLLSQVHQWKLTKATSLSELLKKNKALVGVRSA
uniref:Uncharacterized protein n=1 Tax=Solanum lycopersicum TaxID=4081 RepID=A0A494G9B5_SOLLC